MMTGRKQLPSGSAYEPTIGFTTFSADCRQFAWHRLTLLADCRSSARFFAEHGGLSVSFWGHFFVSVAAEDLAGNYFSLAPGF